SPPETPPATIWKRADSLPAPRQAESRDVPIDGARGGVPVAIDTSRDCHRRSVGLVGDEPLYRREHRIGAAPDQHGTSALDPFRSTRLVTDDQRRDPERSGLLL